MEQELKNTAFQHYLRQQQLYCLDVQAYAEHVSVSFPETPHAHPEHFPSWQEFHDNFHITPSDNILRSIFLHHSTTQEAMYQEHFRQLRASTLSCDHTFKVSMNIGYERKEDKRWTTQYDSLFMVMNEYGQVMGFEFTKSTAFENILPLLRKIKLNLQEEPVDDITLVMLDNCCHWRRKIHTVFPNAAVHLDLFHAVQRVGRTIPRISAFRQHILSNLSSCFRQQSDHGPTRQEATPGVQTLVDGFQSFVTTWGRRAYENDPAIGCETKRACENLFKHIKKGCLSDIPAGAGTNKNERLHKFLNSSALAVGRLGPELALALLTVLLFKWNLSCVRNAHKDRIFPPAEYILHSDLTQGTLCSYESGDATNAPQRSSLHVRETLPVVRQTDQAVEQLDPSEATLLIEQCNRLNRIFSLVENSNICTLDKLLWAKQNFPHITSSLQENLSTTNHSQLTNNIKRLRLSEVQIVADGNCLFRSIAQGLLPLAGQHSSVQEHLKEINLLLLPEHSLHVRLRQLVVDHIIDRWGQYQSYAPNCDVHGMETFRMDGVFDSNLGDLLIVGASHTLKLAILVVTAHPDFPVLLLENEHASLCNEPIFVSYNQDGPGHYNLLVAQPNTDEPAITPRPASSARVNTKGCRCGQSSRKPAETSKFCKSSRCPCFAGNSECGHQCQCWGCSNPYGSSQNSGVSRQSVKKRMRRKPHVKFISKTGHDHLSGLGQSLTQGGWTMRESIMFHVLCMWQTKGRRIKRPNWSRIMSMYNALASRQYEQDQCRVKTKAQIVHKLLYSEKVASVLNAML